MDNHIKQKKLEEKQPSSEELFITNFLEERDFTFKSEVVLNDLKGDHKKYRVVDFYLPKFKVYVEYFGNYNSTKERRAEYDKKVEVYIKNDKPTVFLYPHELGILEYAFHVKLLKVLSLKKFGLKKQLFRYKLKRYFDKEGFTNIKLMGIPIFVFFVIFNVETGFHKDFLALIVLTCFACFCCGVFLFIKDIIKYFIRN